MYFQYIAYTQDKKVTRGVQAAVSEDIALKILTAQGYKILSIKQSSNFLSGGEQFSRYFNRVTPEAIVTFSRQLALLHESGMDIIASLGMLKEHITSRMLKKAIGEIITDLNRGARLSEAMGKHPRVFSKIYCQSIKVGEMTGNLEAVLREMADYVEREAKSARGIRNAMKYPVTVVIVGILVLIVLVTFVLPSFMSLYRSMNVELPAITRAMLAVLDWFSGNGLYILAGLCLAGILAYAWTRTAEGKLMKDKIALKLPLLGRVAHLNELIRCCRNTSILYKSGLPVPEIISLVIDTTDNMVMKQSLIKIRKGILRGEGLSHPMSEDPVFFRMMVQMVGVGESTGGLDRTLTATADTYETEAEERMRSIIGLIQPTVTIVMGAVVALIALSLVSAMYSMYGQMG